MATTLEALPKSVVVADSVGRTRPSSFLVRSTSEPHMNYMFSKYDHTTSSETNALDSSVSSPSSSRSPSPNGKDESVFSNPEDDDSSTSTTGSSTPKRPAPVLERRHTLRGGPDTFRHTFSGSMQSPKSKKRPTSVSFMRASASEGQVVTLSSHRPHSSFNLSPKDSQVRKDELWIAFKQLEGDYSKFNCKLILQRTHVLRSTLIPFLRKFDGRTSLVPISIEELDRRLRTLNKWWALLISSLRGTGERQVPAQDVQTYIEGITGIFTRPEWRAAPSTLAPSSTLNPSPSNSCSSLSSASSSMSYEKSLQYDMRVMYTTSLLDTLAFALDGLSIPQNGWIVHFGGKVIAYAFFFCNGVSEMLIGLLGLKAPQLRKVLNQYAVGRGTDLHAVAEGVIGEFPSTLHSVGFTSMSAALPRLKKPSNYMVATSNINWTGPWVYRWIGRETELFFVFVKHYHILLSEYLPVGTTPTAKLCAPGYIFIQAQLLSLLETAIQRGPAHLLPQESVPTNITFDDIVGAHLANSNNVVQQAPSKTMYKPLMDQRIFSLVKDITTDRNFNDAMRDCFAVSFARLLKALAVNTKIVEHAACVSLCDVLEEAIPALYQFERLSETGNKYIDWGFWLDVSREMIKNENTMSDLRLFSFIFVIWDLLTEDQERKRSVCLDWLLGDEMWDRYFAHWCPMVRAFYMRLLCWRVGRLPNNEAGTENTTPSKLDDVIYGKLLGRLESVYATYVWQRNDADQNSKIRPSITPCPPAPNRRLAIIRIETQPGFGRPFSLDKPFPPPPSASPPPSEESKPSPPANPVPQPEANGNGQADATVGSVIKKKWSLLRAFVGAAEALKPDIAPVALQQRSPSPPKTSQTQTPPNGAARSPASSATYVPPRGSSGRDAWQSTKVPFGAAFGSRTRTHFKFVLEFAERAPLARKGKGGNIPRLPRLTEDHLQSHGGQENKQARGEPVRRSFNAKYFGRALAEWAIVVDDLDNFIERRKNEGSNGAEVPILSVDSLRKM